MTERGKTEMRAARRLWSFLALLGVGSLAACGTEPGPINIQEPVYTLESPPPFVRSDGAGARGRLGVQGEEEEEEEDEAEDGSGPRWTTVASGTVFMGKAKTISGSRYSLKFEKGSLTVGSLAATIREYDRSVIDFELGPHGAQFATPVTLTISFGGTNADPSSSTYVPGLLVFFYYNPVTTFWEPLPSTIDSKNKKCYIKLTHFSRYALARIPLPGTGDW